MNTTSFDVTNTLSAASNQLNIYFGSFLCIMGSFGSFGNIIVFRTRTFRERAYAIYLTWEAVSNIVYFNFVLMTRILQKGFQLPVLIRFDIICKLRQFFTDWSNQVSFTLFSYATIDRILSTQREIKYRRWSNRVNLAGKLCIGCAIVWLLIFGHRLFLYMIANGTCSPKLGFYSYFDNYTEVFLKAILPPITMIILTHLLIRNVRAVIQRRIFPINKTILITMARRSALHQMDSQLALMLILQSIIATITFIPFAVELIYTNITQEWQKSALRIAQEKLFTESTHLMSYLFFVSSFYVSIISSAAFRRQIKRLFKYSQLNGQRANIHTVQHSTGTNNIQPTENKRH